MLVRDFEEGGDFDFMIRQAVNNYGLEHDNIGNLEELEDFDGNFDPQPPVLIMPVVNGDPSLFSSLDLPDDPEIRKFYCGNVSKGFR